MLIHLFDPIRFKNIAVINYRNGDIVGFKYRLNKNAPHQAIIRITSKFARFNDIRTRRDFGIRLQKDNQDLLFVFNSRRMLDDHTIELNMMSYAFKLQNTPLQNRGRILRGYSLQQFLGELDQTIQFVGISGNRNVNVTCGNKDNLTLLSQAVRYANFYEWVDLGLEELGGQLRPVVGFGSFREIDDYYNTTSDARLKPLKINNHRKTDNIYDDDLLVLSQASEYEGNVGFSLVYPFFNSGTGSSDNTAVVLRRTNYSFVDPQFPIVPLVSPITGETLYHVRNPFTRIEEERVQIYEYQDATATQDEQGNFTTVREVSEEILYRRTISYIQAFQTTPSLQIGSSYKKLLMAGTRVTVDFEKEVRDYDGSVVYTQTFAGDYILDNIEDDLELIV